MSNSASCADQFIPGPGQFRPINAFGGVWCDNPDIREALGWGIAKERSMGGGIQEFEGGLILRNEDQTQLYVLFSDDQSYMVETKP